MEFPATNPLQKLRHERYRDGAQADDKVSKSPPAFFDPSGPQIRYTSFNFYARDFYP